MIVPLGVEHVMIVSLMVMLRKLVLMNVEMVVAVMRILEVVEWQEGEA